jgi:hypothetical protein
MLSLFHEGGGRAKTCGLASIVQKDGCSNEFPSRASTRPLFGVN